MRFECRRGLRRSAVVLVAAAVLAIQPVVVAGSGKGKAASSPWEWKNVSRVVVIGDAHGSASEVELLLTGLGIVDESLGWTGGTTHLVFIGDLLDRGPEERKLLDLVRRLESEAPEAGGRVHVLLGNHEIMNLVRDLRYVSKAGFAAFEDLEGPKDRAQGWRMFRRTMAGSDMDKEQLQEAFNDRHPPGYFGRVAAFGPDGTYGSWLVNQPVMIKIDGVVFVHGGLTDTVARLGIDKVNEKVHQDLRKFWLDREMLERFSVVGHCCSFEQLMQAANETESEPEAISNGGRLRTASSDLLDFLDSLAISPDGPVWYRGLSLEDERIERFRFEEVLGLLDATAVVVGHAITRDGKITSRFGGRLFRTDVGMQHSGAPAALVLEKGKFRVFDPATGKLARVRKEPPHGQGEAVIFSDFPDAFLLRFLSNAKISDFRPLGKGSTRPLLLELYGENFEMRGLFKTVAGVKETVALNGRTVQVTDDYSHEIAAYLLDRAIGLGMVPVTVERHFSQRGSGSLQRWIESAVDQSAARNQPLPPEHLEAVATRRERIRIFDALIGNLDRSDSDILHLPQQHRVWLVDHSKAFNTVIELDFFLGERACVLDHEMEQALRSLSASSLDEQLRDRVSRKQIRALLTRRDGLLERCTSTPY